MTRLTAAGWALFLLSFTACNDAPEGGVVAILPENPTTVDDLLLDIVEDATDPNKKDIVLYDIAWLKDGEVQPDYAGAQSVASSDTEKHEVWSVEVTPKDDKIAGVTFSASTTILNTPPEVTSGSLSPNAPKEGDSVVVSASHADVDNDPVTLTYEWYVDDEKVDGSGPSLSSDSFAKNQKIHVVLTPNDGEEDGEPFVVEAVTAGNSAPEISSADIDPQEAYEDTTLTCVPDGWYDADDDPEGYRFLWTVNSTDVGTTNTLTGADFDKGDTVRCQITPWDGEDEGSPRTSDPIEIRNTAPSLDGVKIGPEGPTEGTLVEATLGSASDIDGDEVTFGYEWFVNSTSTATTEMLGSELFDKGDSIYLEVTPFDGTDYGVAVRSNTLTVGNTAPSAPATVTIDPAAPTSDEDFVCKAGGATDVDGDSLTYEFSWTLNGRAWSGATSKTTWAGDTISASSTSEGQVWVCTANAHDGTDAGPSKSASAKVVAAWKGRAVFTNCGKTGETGPTQSQCDTAYRSTPIAGKVTVSKGIQKFTIPSDGKYRIEAWGAQGGHCAGRGGCGAKGARMRGDFNLKKGDVLHILVGQLGIARGFGAGGGGGTFVVKGGTSPLIIAGGGGGAGHILWSGGNPNPGTTASCGTTGKFSAAGKGGCSGNGGYSSSSYGGTYNNSGGGGGLNGNGVGNGTKTNPGYSFKNGGNGGSNTGGFGGGGGGIAHSWSCSNGNGGGSGGGGYSGGGGGGGSCNGGGGGGGSYNVGSSASNSSGVQSGHGKVHIDKL